MGILLIHGYSFPLGREKSNLSTVHTHTCDMAALSLSLSPLRFLPLSSSRFHLHSPPLRRSHLSSSLVPRVSSASPSPSSSSPSSRSSNEPRSGVPLYKPRSYEVLVSDAAKSLVYALDNGKTRLEIDFPYVIFLINCDSFKWLFDCEDSFNNFVKNGWTKMENSKLDKSTNLL